MSTAARTLIRLGVLLVVTLVVIAGTVVAVERGAGSLIVGSTGRGRGEVRFEGQRAGDEDREDGGARRGPGREGERGSRTEGGQGFEGDREDVGRGGFGWSELWGAARQMASIAVVVIVLSILWRPISRRLRKRRQRRAPSPG